MARQHPLWACDRELRADPRRDVFRCEPKTWTCSCGRRFEHVCDEAEGCSWVLVEGGDGRHGS